jgi:beta-galactosidase
MKNLNKTANSRRSVGKRLSLDPGWLFHPGDVLMPEIKDHYGSYMNAKAGTAWGAAAPDFDDTE